MKKRRNPFSKVKIVFRPGSPAVKVALIVVIVLSAVALFTINGLIQKKNAEIEAGKQHAAALEHDNKDLTDKNNAAGTLDGIIDVAGDEWGLGLPGSEDVYLD